MPPIRWFDNTSVQEAVDTAAQHGTPMLVDFWSPTCSGCAKLFATTYRDADVQAYLARTFVCLKYNTKAPNPWFKRLNGSYGHHWHPNVVVMDHRLTEARRFIGYLSADEFVAQLEVGRALIALRHGQAVESLAMLQGVHHAVQRHVERCDRSLRARIVAVDARDLFGGGERLLFVIRAALEVQLDHVVHVLGGARMAVLGERLRLGEQRVALLGGLNGANDLLHLLQA